MPSWLERPLRRIVASCERMARIISELLDLTRGRLGGDFPIVRREVDLAAVLRHVVDELAAAHPARALSFEVRGDGAAEVDPERVAQLASNLAGNALQHGAPGSPVRVRLESADGEVSISVHNLGAIPASEIEVIFEPFRQRAAGGPARGGGLGLGLYIAQQIARAHGGTLDVRSSVEEGTTFTARFPGRATTPPA